MGMENIDMNLVNISPICDNSVTTQKCHNTTVSQLKICDFSGETYKGFEML